MLSAARCAPCPSHTRVPALRCRRSEPARPASSEGAPPPRSAPFPTKPQIFFGRRWCRRSRSGGKASGRAADGVRRPGGLPSGAGGAAGLLLRAVARLLRPAQVDDARCALLPSLQTAARHSRALVCAGGREAWRLRPSAGTTGTGGRLEGAGGAWSCALRVALDVMPGARVQDAHDPRAVGEWALGHEESARKHDQGWHRCRLVSLHPRWGSKRSPRTVSRVFRHARCPWLASSDFTLFVHTMV